jgi:predicted aspartyl protease
MATRVALITVILAALLAGPVVLGGSSNAGTSAAPMRVVRGAGGEVTAVVTVTVNDHAYPFVVDTGAAGSMIDAGVARELGLPEAGGARSRVSGIGGTVDATAVMVDGWAVGPVALPRLRMEALPLGGALGGGAVGLLGSDVLSRFESVTLDFGAERLELGG